VVGGYSMRSRKTIENDGAKVEYLILEVLLDIRELLKKKTLKKKT
jgi:hypothetical protein